MIAPHETPPEGGAPADASPDEQVTGSLERLSAVDEARGSHLAEVRDVAFPVALRGYEREAVDAYVERVSRLVAELESSRSPEGAVRRALDQVGEETSGILQRAQETASEITARSRTQADDRLREAEREAADVTSEAEERLRELDADFARIWDQRDRLLDEVRGLAERLLAVADDAEDRWAPQREDTDVASTPETASIPQLAGHEVVEAEAGLAGQAQPEPSGGATSDSPDFVEVYDHEGDFAERDDRGGMGAAPGSAEVPREDAVQQPHPPPPAETRPGVSSRGEGPTHAAPVSEPPATDEGEQAGGRTEAPHAR